MNNIKAVIFDVDGVLLESLIPHLKICEDLNVEFKLGLKIPNAKEFKELVREGVKISPMQHFFSAVGFPVDFAIKADLKYQKRFNQEYPTSLYPRVKEALSMLQSDGYLLGIVTANVIRNIESALGDCMGYFHPECIFAKDTIGNLSKTDALLKATKLFKIEADNVIYIGDQPKDYVDACNAGVNFLGVTYGWGISNSDSEFPKVDDIIEIPKFLRM